MEPKTTVEREFSQNLLDVLIRAGLIAFVVISCFEIFSPFHNLMLWSLILAITLYPLHCKLKRRLGIGDGRSATLLVLIAIAILLVPVYLLGNSLVESVQVLMTSTKSDGFHVPPPPDAVASWPLIGKPLHDFWLDASSNLSAIVQKFVPRIKDISLLLLGKLADAGMGLLIFIFALIIAGVIVAFGAKGHKSAVHIFTRIAGPERGPRLTRLCTSTIRAVAVGVIGIAFIQMFMAGLGFVLMDIPGAGLLAMGVLLLGIMQLPASIITLSVVVYVFATEGASVVTVIFAIYMVIAGLIDNILKPLLLGRGVDVPMPVVLIGALGGMVTSGIVGLFTGPVMLAVGYQLFWQWVEQVNAPELASTD